jgi:multicomponent Na+:H+ antiporter subunit B
MPSLILQTVTRFLLVLLVLFSIFVLLRGHNEPGGGFIGGLLAAGAIALQQLANGVEAARKTLRVDPRTLIGAGLLVAALSGCAALLAGRPFLTGLWVLGWQVPGIGKLSTVLAFDVGVYLVVIGVTLLILFTLGEE